MKLVIDGIEIRSGLRGDVVPLDGPYSVSATIHLHAETIAFDAWIAALFDLCPFLAIGWAARWGLTPYIATRRGSCRPAAKRCYAAGAP